MALNKHTQHPHHPLPLFPGAVAGDRCLSMPVSVPVLLSVCLSPTHRALSSGTCPDSLAVSALSAASRGGWSFPSHRGASSPPLLGPAPCPAEAVVAGEGMAVGGPAGLKAAGLCLVTSEGCAAKQQSGPCGKKGWPQWNSPSPLRVTCSAKWGFVVAATSPRVRRSNTRRADVLPFSYSSPGSMAFSQGCRAFPQAP